MKKLFRRRPKASHAEIVGDLVKTLEYVDSLVAQEQSTGRMLEIDAHPATPRPRLEPGHPAFVIE